MLPMFLSHHPIPRVPEEASGQVLQLQLLRALLGIQMPHEPRILYGLRGQGYPAEETLRGAWGLRKSFSTFVWPDLQNHIASCF